MNNTEVLEKIGLSKGESKVYLALLKQKISSIGPIVKESGVSRSKVYEIVNRLIEKGLVSSILEEGVNRYKAIDPRLILDYLDKKKIEIEEQKDLLKQNLPNILELALKLEEKQSVEVFQGWNAIKNIFSLLIKDAKKKDEWFAFGIPKQMNKEREEFFKQWRKETDKIGIKQNLLADERIRASAELAPKSKYSYVRYIKQETATSIDIFKDNTLIGIWTNKPIIILIKGREVADSFKEYFGHLWKQGRK